MPSRCPGCRQNTLESKSLIVDPGGGLTLFLCSACGSRYKSWNGGRKENASSHDDASWFLDWKSDEAELAAIQAARQAIRRERGWWYLFRRDTADNARDSLACLACALAVLIAPLWIPIAIAYVYVGEPVWRRIAGRRIRSPGTR